MQVVSAYPGSMLLSVAVVVYLYLACMHAQ